MKFMYQKAKLFNTYFGTKIRTLLLWSIALFLLGGCAKTPKPSKPKHLKKTGVAVQFLAYDYMSIKSKVRYTADEKETKVTADIRIGKDSLIWISLRNTTGIEGARVLISKDSLQMIDRINKRYFVYDYKSISKRLNFDFDYSLFETIIVGNGVLDSMGAAKLKRKHGAFVFEDKIKDKVKRKLPNEEKEKEKRKYEIDNVISPENNKISKVSIVDKKYNKTLDVSYSLFEELNDGQLFARTCMAMLRYARGGKNLKATMEMKHNKVVLSEDPISFPFKVSSKYKVERLVGRK